MRVCFAGLFFLGGLEAFLEDKALVVLMIVWAWTGLVGSTDLCGFVLAVLSVQMLVCSLLRRVSTHSRLQGPELFHLLEARRQDSRHLWLLDGK